MLVLKKRKVLYLFEILSFFSGLYQKKPAPVKEGKVSLKIHRADLRDREICPTGRLFLLYVCNMV